MRVFTERCRDQQEVWHRHRESPACDGGEESCAGVFEGGVDEVACFGPGDVSSDPDVPAGYPVATERRHQLWPVATPRVYEAEDFPIATSAIRANVAKNRSA